MGEDEQIRGELDSLKEEHRSLDMMIGNISDGSSSFDQLHLRRLKKRKLWVKDRISHLLTELQPDIIA